MRVMSCPSATNETGDCGSEASSRSSNPSSMSGQTQSPLPPHSDTSQHEAPPPPPLPPPPRAPPPPPPPPASANHGQRKKRRVRSFFWKPIPEEKVRGKPNIWTMAVRQQQYQIDVRSVEELFGQQEDTVAEIRGPTPTVGRSVNITRSRSFKESSKDEISILDSKRGMNVGIFLKQFKKSNLSIVEDIRRGEGKIYGAELLKDLLRLLPDTEEIKKLQSYEGDPSKLTLVDSFMYLLIQVPRFEVRIEAMVLHEEFLPSCAVMSREIDIIRLATTELMNCEELHAILHLVLQAGNIMNAGGYAGNAVGFKLSSLLSLADTKANKPGMNLLHFVALEAKKKDEKLLKFPEKLQDVQSAARISVENIEMEFSSLYVRTRSLQEKVQGDQELKLQLEPFLKSSAQTLQDLKRRRLDLRKEGNTLIDFFCEDKDTFKLDECFRIFQDFCFKFEKAVKDNCDRELKDAARLRRLRELEEKRFAWASADHTGGFGRSSSENDVDMLTKDGLLDFFQQRSQSPHSPVGRSSSARRHRHTMTTMAEHELHGYLEFFGGNGNVTNYSKYNSLPRSGRAFQRRPASWLLSQDDNRELGQDRHIKAMSPCAATEPISPLARFSTSMFDANEDPYNNNNNNYSSVSEGSALPNSCFVFQKTTQQSIPTITGHMNVSVEKHTLVRGPQAFDLTSPNNNSNHMHFVNKGDMVVTDVERERQSPPRNLTLDNLPDYNLLEREADLKAVCEGKIAEPAQFAASFKKEREEEEDFSTVSSTTCDTPLPLDTSPSNKKPALYVLDCAETDCSVTLDCSELESSPLMKEGSGPDLKTTTCDQSQQDPSSLSSNLESMSTNDNSVSASTNANELPAPGRTDTATATPPANEEWDANSCDTAEGTHVGERGVQTDGSVKAADTKRKAVKTPKGNGSGGLRTLTPSENQGMRKVVPISRLVRTGSNKRAERPSGHDGGEVHRPLRDQSTPARGRSEKTIRPHRHSSLPPDESKAQSTVGLTKSTSTWSHDSIPRKSLLRKPSIKPPRSVPKPPPEEKICRSTMRALAQAQAQALTQVHAGAQSQAQASSEGSSSQTLGPKSPSGIPSFARNTVASTSRVKKELGPPSVPSTPSRSPSIPARAPSVKQTRVSTPAQSTAASGQHAHPAEERPRGITLRRVHSVKAASRSTYRSNTPPPPVIREDAQKSAGVSEKSVQPRDMPTPSRVPKPNWK